MTPIPDTSGTGRASGTYVAVRARLEQELGIYGRSGPPPPIIGATLSAMADRQPVEVPAWALPPWLRPPFTPGDPEPMAVITPDDRVELRQETGRDICQWLGID
ncbi:MAG TPA: hypothetical protein VLZ05_12835 [Mycobacterium sp.]|nr:hypothetical protein [Mycobacterium sp.]HUH69663.1 hypothetical protein [Mycobacterium sp.]